MQVSLVAIIPGNENFALGLDVKTTSLGRIRPALLQHDLPFYQVQASYYRFSHALRKKKCWGDCQWCWGIGQLEPNLQKKNDNLSVHICQLYWSWSEEAPQTSARSRQDGAEASAEDRESHRNYSLLFGRDSDYPMQGVGFRRSMLWQSVSHAVVLWGESKKMGSDTKERATVIEISSPSKREKPRRDCICRIMNVFTAICALLCLVRSHFIPAQDNAGIAQSAVQVSSCTN